MERFEQEKEKRRDKGQRDGETKVMREVVRQR